MADRIDLLEVTPQEAEAALTAHFAGRGEPAYRARQVLSWLYDRRIADFAAMTDLPARERAALDEAFTVAAPVAAAISVSDDGTAKHLWRMADGELVESVLIPTTNRVTLCISSQAGCAMACVFCATGWSGYRRNLTAGEIVAQYRGAASWAAEHGLGEITNIVFMGMGEPFMNTDAVMRSLTLLNGAYGVGARRITVSTVGVIPGIRRLAERPEQFGLALSLHAPNPELRRRLVPIEKKYPLDQLMAALQDFVAAGGRRITFEYVLLDGVNDSLPLAAELAALARSVRAHVNLIPYNPVPGAGFRPPAANRTKAFAAAVREHGVEVTVRTPRGRDIAAACGQLRAEHATRPPKPYLALLTA
ncbi:MAG TPA: 23S rRNA (adenine(2503)-C(2))-methyltransferase RlmN [Longimicrobiales bacterium]|nr:23S rRNA (adenine(2503)-C(2))-methyltransferase RlmN [Longimicrobiales bacterium]